VLLGIVVSWAAFFVMVVAVKSGSHGLDFLAFYQGAYADAHGVNPYHAEGAWFSNRLALFPSYRGPVATMVFLDPPTFSLLIRPLTALSEPNAYRIWVACLALALGGGISLCLYEWQAFQRWAATVLATISPLSLFALNLGQNVILVLFSLGIAQYLLASNLPFLAGLGLSLGWQKPHVGLPIAAILVLASMAEHRRPLLAGALTGVAVQVAVTSLVDHGAVRIIQWWTQMTNFGASLTGQLDIASIAGVYHTSAPPTLQHLLDLICLLAAALTIGYLVLATRCRGDGTRQRLLYGGIAAWLTFSPYEHTSDQVLLLVPLLVLIGENLAGLRTPLILLATLACILGPICVSFDFHVEGIQAFAPALVLLAYLLHQPLGVQHGLWSRHAVRRTVPGE
jgi:hypothetical protein